MSQSDDQKQDPQDPGEGYQEQGGDETSRESRGEASPADSEQNQGTQPQDKGSDLDEADDLDEDRDEDSRSDGGANRRNNIG